MMIHALPVHAACALLLCACSTNSTARFDQRFGQSLRAIQAGQTIYPQGSANGRQAVGMAGEVAAKVLENYRRSFDNAKRETARRFELQELGR